MKKGLVLLIILLLLTGCGKRLDSKKQVNKFLKQTYSGEKFEVLDGKTVKEEMDSTCGDGTVKLHVWKVHSKSEDVDFEVRESYEFNSFVCEYKRVSKYEEAVIDKLYGNVWTKDDYLYTYNASVSLTKEELYKELYDIYLNLRKHYPFKNKDKISLVLKVVYGDTIKELRYEFVESLDDVKRLMEK